MRDLRIVFCAVYLLSYVCLGGLLGWDVWGTYDDLGIPVPNFSVVVFFYLGEGSFAGL